MYCLYVEDNYLKEDQKFLGNRQSKSNKQNIFSLN